MRAARARHDPFMADAVARWTRAIARDAAAEHAARRALVKRRHAVAPRRSATRCSARARRRAADDHVRRRSLRRRRAASSSGAWNFNGGMWHPYTLGEPARDRATARSRGRASTRSACKSRVKGDYHTVSDVIETPVIDRLGRPAECFADKAAWNGDDARRPGVGHRQRQRRAGRVRHAGRRRAATRVDRRRRPRSSRRADFDDARRSTARSRCSRATRWATSRSALVAPFHGQAGATGCALRRAGAPERGRPRAVRHRRLRPAAPPPSPRLLRARASTATFVATLHAVGRRVGRRVAAPGCRLQQQRPERARPRRLRPTAARQGQLPFCIDNTCVCSDDIPPGRIGPYSRRRGRRRTGRSGCRRTRRSHGDLVVAQAHGRSDSRRRRGSGSTACPTGPVIVPGSMIRGGIADDGPNVGMYTSIAVARRRHADGDVLRSSIAASLKFAAKVGGTWQIHIVELRHRPDRSGRGGALVGMYTSITLRSDDGRPGVAYLAHVTDADRRARRGSLRAGARSPVPTSAGRLDGLGRRHRDAAARRSEQPRRLSAARRASACSSTRRATRRPGAGRHLLRPRERRPQAREVRRGAGKFDDADRARRLERHRCRLVAVGRRSTRRASRHVAYVERDDR